MSVEVHFETRNKDNNRRLVARPTSAVKAIILLPHANAQAFAKTVMSKGKPINVHRQELTSDIVQLLDEQGNATTLNDGDSGPPVCYWVNEEWICW